MPRCPARTRTAAGWERCHAPDGHDSRHHAGDRTWDTQGFTFTELCRCQPADVIRYYGARAAVPQKNKPRDGWPPSWKTQPVS